MVMGNVLGWKSRVFSLMTQHAAQEWKPRSEPTFTDANAAAITNAHIPFAALACCVLYTCVLSVGTQMIRGITRHSVMHKDAISSL